MVPSESAVQLTFTVVCPKCDGRNVNQYRMPSGPMWCDDCGYRVEEKEGTGNPFLRLVHV